MGEFVVRSYVLNFANCHIGVKGILVLYCFRGSTVVLRKESFIFLVTIRFLHGAFVW